jgi:hypothetical protein
MEEGTVDLETQQLPPLPPSMPTSPSPTLPSLHPRKNTVDLPKEEKKNAGKTAKDRKHKYNPDLLLVKPSNRSRDAINTIATATTTATTTTITNIRVKPSVSNTAEVARVYRTNKRKIVPASISYQSLPTIAISSLQQRSKHLGWPLCRECEARINNK